MAGKLYVDRDGYVNSSNTRALVSPFGKLAKAYAEGYRGSTVVPSGDVAAFAAYTAGQNDKTAAKPPGHCAP